MTTAAMWQPGFGPISLKPSLISKRMRRMKIKLPSIKPRKRVWWTDPDNGTCSGWGVITKAQEPVQLDSLITLKMDSGSCVEALPNELSESKDGTCEACGGLCTVEDDGPRREEIERCDACELYENDRAAVEAVVETARSQRELLRLVKE